jgi:hypothetical protein
VLHRNNRKNQCQEASQDRLSAVLVAGLYSAAHHPV